MTASVSALEDSGGRYQDGQRNCPRRADTPGIRIEGALGLTAPRCHECEQQRQLSFLRLLASKVKPGVQMKRAATLVMF
jgi:hypothetical protein